MSHLDSIIHLLGEFPLHGQTLIDCKKIVVNQMIESFDLVTLVRMAPSTALPVIMEKLVSILPRSVLVDLSTRYLLDKSSENSVLKQLLPTTHETPSPTKNESASLAETSPAPITLTATPSAVPNSHGGFTININRSQVKSLDYIRRHGPVVAQHILERTPLFPDVCTLTDCHICKSWATDSYVTRCTSDVCNGHLHGFHVHNTSVGAAYLSSLHSEHKVYVRRRFSFSGEHFGLLSELLESSNIVEATPVAPNPTTRASSIGCQVGRRRKADGTQDSDGSFEVPDWYIKKQHAISESPRNKVLEQKEVNARRSLSPSDSAKTAKIPSKMRRS